MALYVSDLAKARGFYEDFLGYGEPYVLKRKDGTDRIAFVKINEDQYLELFAEEPQHNDGQLNHISVATDDANAMREYLAAKDVKVPDKVGKGQIKNSNFNIIDPDAIVLGGGLSNVRALYAVLPPLIENYVFSDVFDTPVLAPMHGDSSGVRGAAWLWPIDEIEI